MSPRVYVRKFDWDEARQLRTEDPKTWSWNALSDHFGVSPAAVARVVRPGLREKMNAHSVAWVMGGVCVDCGKLGVSRAHRGAASRCQSCANLARATTVRPHALQCALCQEWKSDDEFPYNRSRSTARRGRHGCCRPCLTAAKRDYRSRNKVPCSHGCGRLVDGTNRRDNTKPPECVQCATARITTMLIAEGRLGKRKAAA